MKKIITVWAFYMIAALSAQAQVNQPEGKLVPKSPFKIEVGQITTTVIIFPFEVKEADRGTANVLASKVPGVENVIKLKAINAFQDTTNVHVFTADGRVYTFTVTFNPSPLNTTYEWNLNGFSKSYVPVQFYDNLKNDKEINELAKKVWTKRATLHRRSKKSQMKLILKSIYYDGDVMLSKLRLENRSGLAYQANWVKLYLTDQKQAKRSSIQELTINMIYSDPLPYVKARNYTEWLIVFPKTTIDKNKKLLLEVQEKDGSRNLSLEIRNKDLFTAKRL